MGGNTEKSVVITFETIYEILRREKSKEDIQKLDDSFFEDVVKYLNEKTDFKLDSSKKNDMFSSFTGDDVVIQIQNIKKILKELYDRREKKIIDIAVNKARTNSSLISTNALLGHEKILFESIVSILLSNRNNILFPLLNGEAPVSVKFPESKPELKSSHHTSVPVSSNKFSGKLIRFLEPVDAFVGSELEEYGPFSANDRAYIPPEIASILIENGKAVELSGNQ